MDKRWFFSAKPKTVLTGKKLYQFSGAKGQIFVTAKETCSVVRCGKNLMRPVGDMPVTITSTTKFPLFILRTEYMAHYKEILKHPRTYSFSISKNTTTKGYLDCQEYTNEYATGYMRIVAGKTGNFEIFITNTTATYTQSVLPGCYYFANKTISEGEEVEVSNFMCALGNDNSFEPYTGINRELAAGETVSVPALDGINTIIGSSELTVQYEV